MLGKYGIYCYLQCVYRMDGIIKWFFENSLCYIKMSISKCMIMIGCPVHRPAASCILLLSQAHVIEVPL